MKVMREKRYLRIGLERTGTGHERKNTTPSRGSAHATLYADYTSAHESEKTIRNLEKNGEEEKIKIDIKGKEVTEMNRGKVLGLTWNTNLGWRNGSKPGDAIPE